MERGWSASSTVTQGLPSSPFSGKKKKKPFEHLFLFFQILKSPSLFFFSQQGPAPKGTTSGEVGPRCEFRRAGGPSPGTPIGQLTPRGLESGLGPRGPPEQTRGEGRGQGLKEPICSEFSA